ncbi:MAG: sigma-70 family RNA polymerase sigma factor [Candidatus Zixiibacteriota bacterium]|nr:MAG: sigma-70 family RNA polymerase sigma factor [candidate division Zixibacteria bacterium]
MNSREEAAPRAVPSMESGTEERKLVEAAQNGDAAAFGQLVRNHQKRLFRFIYGLLGSFDQAEDIVQEAFVRAYGAIKRFRAGEAFYPWLSRIARNLAYNQLARQQKQQSLDQMTEAGFETGATDLGPLEQMMNDENNRRFYRALQAMPAEYRAVFVLRQFEQMDYAEIASYLKIPPGTVDSRLYRARRFLMEQLGDLL